MTRGWTSTDLTVVHEDESLWTINDAAQHLGPLPGDPQEMPHDVLIYKLRLYARLHPRKLPPSGKRRSSQPGHPGRYARVYRAADFIALYEGLDRENDERAAAA